MVERGAFDDAMDAAFANVRWMQVREEKSSKSSSESFFFDPQGRRFKELHDIHAPMGLDFGGNWIPVIDHSDPAGEGWAACRSDSQQQTPPLSIKPSSSAASTNVSRSWSGSSHFDSAPATHSRPASFAKSLYDDSASDCVRSSPAGSASSGESTGACSTTSASMSVPYMEQKLAELLLLSNSPNIDSGRIMAAAASLKRDADAVLRDSSLTLQQRTAFRKLRDGVDQLQQTIKNPRMQRAAAASSGSTAAHGPSLSSLPTSFARHAPFVGSEEVEDDWTPRTQNFEQQQPLLQQQQLQLLRLQQDELDFEAGVVEDRRSNLSQISKDAAQVHELFREVAQCVQQGGEQLQHVDQMVDDVHADTLQGARDIRKASKQTSSNIGIGAIVGGALGAGVGSLLGPVGVAAIGSATAVVGGAIAKGVDVLKQKMIAREAKKAGINIDDD